MKISIIIPTYKPKFYLYELLDAIQSQTLDHSLFEVIIVLNGPRFNYEDEIISYLSHTYSDIKWRIIYTEVGNVSNARNIGLNEAKGEYIAFIDDDDIISPNYLECLLKSAEQGIVCVSNSRTFKNNLEDSRKGKTAKIFDNVINENPRNIYALRRFLSQTAYKLIPREIIGNTKYRVNFTNGEDAIFMFEISKNIKELKLCKDCFYYVRVRENSASRNKPLRKRLKNAIRMALTFTMIYIRAPFNYRFKLTLSRIAASLLYSWRKLYS